MPKIDDDTRKKDSVKTKDSPDSEEARRDAWRLCRSLARRDDILAEVVYVLRSNGVAGEARAIKLVFLAVTSRLLKQPISVVLKGPSSAGKSFLLQRTLDLFPREAYYPLTAMSEKSLIYTKVSFEHRTLILYEAAGIPADTGRYLLRSILSEGHVRYATVDKHRNPITLIKEGPTNLIITTTATRLYEDDETRLFSVTLTDTPEQTQKVMARLAEKAEIGHNTDPGMQNHDEWHALQRWLSLSNVEVIVPFAMALSQLVPPSSVPLRRDFGAILRLIQTHALLHQRNRERDEEGRIVAKLQDYEDIRSLVETIVSEGAQASVPLAVAQTVGAVTSLIGSDKPSCTVTEVACELRLDKSAALRRVKRALDLGFLENLEELKGRPARLVLGERLPRARGRFLPDIEQLQEGLQGCSGTEG